MTELQSEKANPEGFAALFEESIAKADELEEGKVIKGRVVNIGKDAVIVDIGYKSEGIVDRSEFEGATGEVNVSVGDEVEVLVEAKETEEGLIKISKKEADRLRVWDEVSAACERDELVEGTIAKRIKGGLEVTISGGVRAFLPGSQVDIRPVRNLDKFLGQSYKFKVIKFNPKRSNIVLSRRALLEQERDTLKEQTLETLEEGSLVQGTIKNLTEYGAFVDLGGIDGLLHITDMSWGRVSHPSELFNVGDEVRVKVLKYSPDAERVSLGLKQITEDPWNNVFESYPMGSKVSGKVVSLTDYGAFVEMETGVEGLVHISEMSWQKPKHPSKVLSIGQEVECLVLDVDAQNKRISLGLKQLEPDPWITFSQKYNPGDIIRGLVRSITEYGVFVEIEEGVDGMVHKSDLSWAQRIANPADLYQKGDEVEAIILSINHDEKKVSLGIKQLYDDPWMHIPQKYSEGSVIEVRIVSLAEYGAFAEIEPGVEALIPKSEMAHEFVEDPSKYVTVGQSTKAEIVAIDAADRKITLSIKDAADREIDAEAVAFQQQQQKATEGRRIGPSGTAGATLGDVLAAKLGNVVAPQEDKAKSES